MWYMLRNPTLIYRKSQNEDDVHIGYDIYRASDATYLLSDRLRFSLGDREEKGIRQSGFSRRERDPAQDSLVLYNVVFKAIGCDVLCLTLSVL